MPTKLPKVEGKFVELGKVLKAIDKLVADYPDLLGTLQHRLRIHENLKGRKSRCP